MTVAEVTRVGWATVQDGGRSGFAGVGVPVSGALHQERYLLATALLSGAPDDRVPAVELLAGGLGLVMIAETILGVVGPVTLRLDGEPAAVGAALRVGERAHVEIEHHGRGPAYVVIGGWAPEATLGSVATDTFSRLGGEVIGSGYRLAGEPQPATRDRIGGFHLPLPEPSGPLRVTEAGHPTLSAFAALTWTVTAVARSGVRLSGGPIASSGSIPSQPVVPGAIQLTPSGEPIVLGPDGGLTGGYPVVGVVATVDVDRLSLLAPGDRVVFRVVDVESAARARDERRRLVARSMAHPDRLP